MSNPNQVTPNPGVSTIGSEYCTRDQLTSNESEAGNVLRYTRMEDSTAPGVDRCVNKHLKIDFDYHHAFAPFDCNRLFGIFLWGIIARMTCQNVNPDARV